ncbi:NFACT family protein [Candidatus Woesearchaeota archaeon]|nr:NFACT family protein [Candidatus Woesearchaeota archaeon]
MSRDYSFIDIACIVKELQVLLDGKIDNIHQVSEDELFLSIFKSSKGRFLLRITPNIIYLSTYKKEADREYGFCKFLRRRIKNAFIRKISQVNSERIVIIEIEAKEARFNLILELFSKGNIILCDENLIIISPLKQQKWKDRDVMPKQKYQLPPSASLNFFELEKKDLKNLIGSKETVKVLAKDFSLGRFYAEKICEYLKIDKNEKNPDIDKLFKLIEKLKSLKIEPNLCNGEALPFKFDENCTNFQSFNEIIDNYSRKDLAEEEKSDIDIKFEEKLNTWKNIEAQQLIHLEEIKETSEKDRIKGDLIYQNYQYIKEILDVIKKARDKKISWIEIEQKLATKNIKVNAKKGIVTLDLK